MNIYRADIGAPAKKIWWALLSAHPFAVVEKAFADHLSTGKFAPVPADILGEITKAAPGDGRPGADEAWALLPRSERASAAMTGEMVAGLAIVQPLIDADDEVAARMAFREAYNRMVGEARSRGEAVHWFLSLGGDPGERKAAQEALRRRTDSLPCAAVRKSLGAPVRLVDDPSHEMYVPARLRIVAQ